MDIDKLRSEAAFANGQADGHQQPPLPNWVVIGELIQERDSLLAVARAAKEVEHTIVMSDDSMLQAVFKLCDSLKNLPPQLKAEIEK
jgi:hypothetical protein